MITCKKGEYLYAGDFSSEDSLTGFGIKSSNIQVEYGQFLNGKLNGFGFFSDISDRLILGEFKDGINNGLTFSLVRGKVTFEYKEGYRTKGIRAFLNETNFGIIDEDDARAVWYRFDNQTLYLRNDNYEEKQFYVPNLVNINDIYKMLDVKHKPTCVCEDMNSQKGKNGLILSGDYNYFFVNKDQLYLLGQPNSGYTDFIDFIYYLAEGTVLYQQKTKDSKSTGPGIVVNKERITFDISEDGDSNGPQFIFTPNKQIVLQMLIYKNNERQYYLAIMSDFTAVMFDVNKNQIVNEFKF